MGTVGLSQAGDRLGSGNPPEEVAMVPIHS